MNYYFRCNSANASIQPLSPQSINVNIHSQVASEIIFDSQSLDCKEKKNDPVPIAAWEHQFLS